MEKLKQKQLQQLKQIEEKIREIYDHNLDILLHNQTIRILIQYSKQQLQTIDVSKIQNINDYSPVSISRLIFDKQLKKIKDQLKKLPNQKCPIDHFLIIMLKVIKLPFERVPFYLLGLKEMFREIKQDQRQNFVSYEQIQSYVLGQVVNFSDQTEHDTQFQIHFLENKMQDFLMHDNGVKKIYYSNDLKKYIVLDQNSVIIKIYDQNMKIVGRFEPNKEKHQKKHPIILNFAYNEFGSKLGISMSDHTFTMVNLTNFLSASSEEAFRSVFLNEVTYNSTHSIVDIYFMSMMNKWLCIDQTNQVWIYDVENVKEENENYCKKFKHPNDDYQIKEVVEIVSLAAIAFVINNEVWFYNETLSKKKFKKFSHCEQIEKFLFSQQRNQFYLVGKEEKYITIFTLNKISGEPTKIWNFPTNQIIRDFNIFSFYNVMLVLDTKNNLKVYSLDDQILQYQQNYDFIVKKKELPIQLVKNSKTSFLIHATYILVMELKKVAIERDMDFAFLETFYYDSNKEQLVFSVNGQIMGLSLMHGQIRKNIASENSNLDKHKAFYMGKNTEPFVIDQKDGLYQVLYKNDERYKQLKDYRKQVGIINVKNSFYDEQFRIVLMISDSAIYLVRNDSQNNFTFKSCLLFENSPHITKYRYYQKTKDLIFLDSTNVIYIMKSYNYEIKKKIKINIFKQWNEGQKLIIDFEYDEQLQVLMVLTNNGQFGIINTNDLSKGVYVKVKDFLPYKLQVQTFTSISYQKRFKQSKHVYSSRVFFFNQAGLFIQFQTDRFLSKIINRDQIAQKFQKFSYIKDTHQLDFSQLLEKQPPQQFSLAKSSLYKQDTKQFNFIKVHDKATVFSKRILLEDYLLLTIGEDGHIKLWGEDRKLYFDLKLPLMLKIEWNMNQIHEKRHLRIIQETKAFLDSTSERIRQNQERAILHMDLKKKLKNKSQKIKINFDNPISLQFQDKGLEEIVISKKDVDLKCMTIDVPSKDKNINSARMNLTQRISQPWKKRKQFQQLYQKASPTDKYVAKFKQKMPFQILLMRNDLHMDQTLSLNKNKKKSKQQQLTILPQLKSYLKAKNNENKASQSFVLQNEDKKEEQSINVYNPQEENKFESCLFVKTQRGPKKGNAFDQIDKYFWRKEHQLLSKKWIPNKRNLTKNNMSLDTKVQNPLYSFALKNSQLNQKVDPLTQVIKIFEEHNKQAIYNRKGRLIRIPHIEKKRSKISLRKK